MAEILTVYPGVGAADGSLLESGASNVSWNTIRTWTVGTVGSTQVSAITGCGSTAWSIFRRGMVLFDTSALTADAIISAATFTLTGTSIDDGLSGNPDVDIVSANPDNDAALAGGDILYTKYGTTVFSSIAFDSLDDAGDNDFGLDQNGMDHISLTGISRFGMRISHDTDNSAPGFIANKGFGFIAESSDAGGTAEDPTLVITFTLPGPANVKTYQGIAAADVKTINGIAIADVKSYNGIL